MPSNFEIAALDDETAKPRATDEIVADVTVNRKYLTLWRRPTPGQYAMFQLRLSRANGREQARGIDRFFTNLMLTPDEIVAEGRANKEGDLYADLADSGEIVPVGLDFFVDLIEQGVIEQDFLIDMLKEAMEVHSGFPTSSASASSASPTTSGPSSTASSRRARSTRSSSPSADS